jgi:MOSC domain-containing protein YiiM
MKIVSTNIGERRVIDWKGELVTTGSFKFSVDKPIFLDKNDVRGDEISNRENHGGTLQAIYGYSIKHYDFFKPSYPDLDWQFGMFGENLTMDDLDETTIHSGDTFKVGEAILEATVQRNPCYKLGIRFNDMKIINTSGILLFVGCILKFYKLEM